MLSWASLTFQRATRAAWFAWLAEAEAVAAAEYARADEIGDRADAIGDVRRWGEKPEYARAHASGDVRRWGEMRPAASLSLLSIAGVGMGLNPGFLFSDFFRILVRGLVEITMGFHGTRQGLS